MAEKGTKYYLGQNAFGRSNGRVFQMIIYPEIFDILARNLHVKRDSRKKEAECDTCKSW